MDDGGKVAEDPLAELSVGSTTQAYWMEARSDSLPMTRNKLLRIKVELEERVDGQTDELAETGTRLKALIDGSLKDIYLHTAPSPVSANHAFGPMLGVANPLKFLPFSLIFDLYAQGDRERMESDYHTPTG